MPNIQNQETLAQIKEGLQAAGAVWVVDYRGLSVKDIQELRGLIRDAGARMIVYKNTLMHLALAELDMTSMDEILAGPSAFVFTGADPVAAAKVIRDFAKKNQNLEIKGGLMSGSFLTADEVQAVASLPSHDQLMGQIAGLISSMARGLAVSINGVASGLARATAAVAEQKEAA